jgi:CBS domain-containing protein
MAATVAEIMDPDAPTLRPEASVDDVVRVFKDSDVGGLPVVNDGGRCVGIVTEADLVIPDEQGDLHIPHYIELFGGLVFLEPLRHFEEKLKKAAALTAQDLMTEDPVTIDASSAPRDAARIMHERRHNRLPVVEHGRYVGLVTRADVIAALVQEP